jgi:hypothetical protein
MSKARRCLEINDCPRQRNAFRFAGRQRRLAKFRVARAEIRAWSKGGGGSRRWRSEVREGPRRFVGPLLLCIAPGRPLLFASPLGGGSSFRRVVGWLGGGWVGGGWTSPGRPQPRVPSSGHSREFRSSQDFLVAPGRTIVAMRPRIIGCGDREEERAERRVRDLHPELGPAHVADALSVTVRLARRPRCGKGPTPSRPPRRAFPPGRKPGGREARTSRKSGFASYSVAALNAYLSRRTYNNRCGKPCRPLLHLHPLPLPPSPATPPWDVF